ncbi:hypothetical protein EV1_011600 [Malus domestica]
MKISLKGLCIVISRFSLSSLLFSVLRARFRASKPRNNLLPDPLFPQLALGHLVVDGPRVVKWVEDDDRVSTGVFGELGLLEGVNFDNGAAARRSGDLVPD